MLTGNGESVGNFQFRLINSWGCRNNPFKLGVVLCKYIDFLVLSFGQDKNLSMWNAGCWMNWGIWRILAVVLCSLLGWVR